MSQRSLQEVAHCKILAIDHIMLVKRLLIGVCMGSFIPKAGTPAVWVL